MKQQYEFRGYEVTVNKPDTLEQLRELVPDECILALYLEYNIARSAVASKFDGENAECPEEVDLTVPGALPHYKAGTRSSKYPVAAKYMETARVMLVKAGKITKRKLKEYDAESEDFSRIVTVAKHVLEQEKAQAAKLDDLIG